MIKLVARLNHLGFGGFEHTVYRMKSHRSERDSMGEMKIPSDRLYGASTQRAIINFPISGIRIPAEIIQALAHLKACCAEVNRSRKVLSPKHAKPIIDACEAIAKGEYADHFVVDVFQTGSGTSTNMNMNEVVANIANRSLGSRVGSHRPIHPNDHVNMGQSSNDVFPSSIHIACVLLLEDGLHPALSSLEGALGDRANAFRKIVKVGRTHLQDATPITLGQEFSGYAAQIRHAVERLKGSLPRLRELAIGGTAVGTGVNSSPKFGSMVCEKLNRRLKRNFVEAVNHFEAQAAQDACVETTGALKTLAVSLTKIGNDIRWMSSGPTAGLSELHLPVVQPGSSIMPGKVNPVIAESLLQVCAETIGHDAAVTWAGASGNFELNTMLPLIGYLLRQSICHLTAAVTNFERRCVRGLTANREKIERQAERNAMLVTVLSPHIGYDQAAAIAKAAYESGRDIVSVAKSMGVKGKLLKLLEPSRYSKI